MKKSRTIILLLKTALLICIVSSIAVLAEIAATILFPPSSDFYIWPPGLERNFTPRADIMPGTSKKVWFRTNSYGLRSYDPSPDDDYRFLVLDGSAAECLYLDQKIAWPRLLTTYLTQEEPNFKVWTGNGARSGQNSRDHIFHMEYLPLRALDVDAIVVLSGVNDFLLRLRKDKGYDPNYLKRPGAREKQIDHAFLFIPYQYSVPPPPSYKKTGLWRAARRVKRIFSADRPQDPEGKVLVGWREKRREAGELRDELPDLNPALREYISNLDHLVDIASKKNIRVIFLTQPALWKSGISPEEEARLWMGGVGNYKNRKGQPYYTPEALARGLSSYNTILKNYCRLRGLECFDLASRIPPQTEFFYDDCHFTEKGSKLVAREVTDYLLSKPPWKEKEPVSGEQ